MLNESPSMPPPHDAQREMEQRALRNVRALVDNMANQETRKRKSATTAIAVVAVVAVIMAVLVAIVLPMSRAQPTQTVIVPPPAKGP